MKIIVKKEILKYIIQKWGIKGYCRRITQKRRCIFITKYNVFTKAKSWKYKAI